VFRIGDLGIVANPCESYGETGLKLRQASPFALTMNIGLANGHAGYIPPPEHFQLGGYTTWRARSSCLEEQAEPKMVSGLIELMQQVHGK
jgi:neutral ceramidase